ncbi:dihydrodipicolinate synthase family protein [Virgibacillus dakarensis]|nr:dihydrodipicolinate synthase family protein [Virgibacillus dakarensis]
MIIHIHLIFGSFFRVIKQEKIRTSFLFQCITFVRALLLIVPFDLLTNAVSTKLCFKIRPELKVFPLFFQHFFYIVKPVLIGTGSTNTREVIELSSHAFHHDADGAVVINPYYWNLSEENLYQHFHEVAKTVDGPILLYNFPTLTRQNLSPGLVLRLVEDHDNIVGIKETIDSTAQIRDMILTVKAKYPNFSVLAGYDDHLFNTLALGGDGAISASVNFAPKFSVDLYHAFRAGDYKTAIELHKKLSKMPLLYQLELPFINVIKEATKLCGIDISTYVQPPARSITKEKREQIKSILQQVGLIEQT